MTSIKRAREPNLIIDTEFQPFIPEGRYRMAYHAHQFVPMYKGQLKCVLTMRVIDYGDLFDVQLNRYYNVLKQGKNYRAKGNMDLARELKDCLGPRALKSGIPWQELKKAVIECEVRTVVADSLQRNLSAVNQYSVIARLVRKVE